MKNKFTWLFVIGMQCMAMSSIHAVSDDNVQVGRLSIEQRHAIITKKLEKYLKKLAEHQADLQELLITL